MRAPWRGMSLARQLLLLQAGIVLAAVLVAASAALLDAREDAEAGAGATVLATAEAVAGSPTVRAALRATDPPSRESAIQSYAEQVRRDSGTDFVVVMRPDRTRLSHPTPSEVGQRFIGHVARARDGESFTETYTGTLGPSVRAVVPVHGEEGDVIGMVSVGITIDEVLDDFFDELPGIIGIAALAFGLAALGTLVVSRRLRRQTHGMGPRAITQMYEYWDAVLHSVHEGLLVIDEQGVLQLANDEAVRLLELPDDAVDRPLADLPLPPSLREVATSGRRAVDELHVVGLHTLVVNQRPAVWEGRTLGDVMTFRDQTELTELAGELDSVRGFADALRSQTHDAANKLHTVITLIETGRPDDAVRLATEELEVTQRLTDRVVGAVSDPVLSALLLGKASQAQGRGVEFTISDETDVSGTGVDPRDLVTLVGNLVDNAIDAALAAGPPRRVGFSATEGDDALEVRVSDTGPGLDPEELAEAVQRGWTTKPAEGGVGRGLGLALVNQVVHRYDGSLRVERDGGAVFVVRLPTRTPSEPAVSGAAGDGR